MPPKKKKILRKSNSLPDDMVVDTTFTPVDVEMGAAVKNGGKTLSPKASTSPLPLMSPSPKSLSLSDVFALEENYDSEHHHSHTHTRISIDSEGPTSSSGGDHSHEDLSVLHRFRMALREVGSHASNAESFIDALRHEFVGDWDSIGPDSPSRQRPEGFQAKSKVKSQKIDIKEGGESGGDRTESKEIHLEEDELRTRVQHILKDSQISNFDIEEIFETIDQDGGGTIEWEEFLSFLSLSPASLRLVITRLHSSLKHDLKHKHSNNMQNMFHAMSDNTDIFEYHHLELYLGQHKSLSELPLTPGEINWMYGHMCGDHVLEVSILEMMQFIKSFHLSHEVSDTNYPVVDIKVSHSQAEEDEYEKLHYHRIPENLQAAVSIKKKGLDRIFLWFRTGSVEDYQSYNKLLRARITDVIVNSDKNSRTLLQQGFICIEKSLTAINTGGQKLRVRSLSRSKAVSPVYLWIRRNWRDPNPVLNIAMTSGKAKNLNDKIHFPPFAGFKLTEPMHNLSSGKEGKDIFLWYRKDNFDHEIFGIVDGVDSPAEASDSSDVPRQSGDRFTLKSQKSIDVDFSPRGEGIGASGSSQVNSSVAKRSSSPRLHPFGFNQPIMPPMMGSNRLVRPPSLWDMKHYRHLFVEMDELQHFNVGKKYAGWVHTHRWNHGLESEWNNQRSMWSKPKIPTISLFGLNALLERLDSSHIMFDVPGRTFDMVMGSITKIAVERGLVPKNMRRTVINCLTQNDKRRAENSDAAETTSKTTTNATTDATTNATIGAATTAGEKGGAETGQPRSDSPKLESHENAHDALEQGAEEDAVHIMVGEVDFLDVDSDDEEGDHHHNQSKEGEEEEDHIGNNLMIFARSLVPVDVGMDEKNAKFFIIILGNSTARARQIDMEMGCSFASLLQDEKIVSCLYQSNNANMLLDVLRHRLRDIHMVPQIHRPTKQGIRKRSKRLTRMLNRLSDRYVDLDQSSRWKARQADTLKDGITLHALWAFAQKYALPLLLGILIALIWSNVDNASYDRLCGPSHHTADVNPSATNETRLSSSSGSGSGGSRMLLSTSSSITASGTTSSCSSPKPTILGLTFNGHDVTLNFLVNDVLMTLFFGLAVKEITEALQEGGSLYPVSKAVNPLIGTLGGVLGPIIVYFVTVIIQNAVGSFGSQDSFAVIANGWGIPTATDISLAWVTALVVFGPGHPAIEHLLLLAIVDDAIGLIIIAVAYGDTANGPMEWWWLGLVFVGIIVAWGLKKMKVMRWELYVCLAGPFTWFGLLMSSLHPALALAFVVPFMPNSMPNKAGAHGEGRGGEDSDDDDDDDDDESSSKKEHDAEGNHAPLHKFEHDLKWFVDCVVLFLFGLTNAGVKLDGIGPLTLSIMMSLVVGKTAGIGLFTLFAVKVLRIPLPRGMAMADVWLLGFIAAIGLTVALFVAGEAFRDAPILQAEAKMGALLSVLVGVVAVAIGKSCGPKCITPIGGGVRTKGDLVDTAGDSDDSDDDDDEKLDDVIVRSMTSTLTSMKRNVAKVEASTGVDHKKLMKRYNHAKKRVVLKHEKQKHEKQRRRSAGAALSLKTQRRASLGSKTGGSMLPSVYT